tara:strand:+ start:616 stop:2181 length:1566 start_codon:yes stop_codon:yes gene_type:complete
MSDGPDFNIENYSLEDLIELVGAASAQTKDSIQAAINNAVTQFEALKNAPAVTFFKEAGEKLLNNFDKLQPLIDSLDQRQVAEPGENIFQNEYYDEGNIATTLAENLPNRRNNTSVVEPTTHMTQGQQRLLIPNAHNVAITQGNMNPTLRNTYQNIINVDSQYREIKSDNITCNGTPKDGSNNYVDSSTDFTFDLSEPMNNVISIAVGGIEIPRTWYPINEQFGTNSFELNGTLVTIPEGFYDDKQTLINAINSRITPTATIDICSNTLKTTITSPGGTPITLNFMPDGSGCNTENSGPKINYNLGWLLGFRQPRYPMVGNPSASYQSEACLDLFGTRYLILKVNDFQSNRITGSMVSLTDNQNKFKTPSYYQRTRSSFPICTDSSGASVFTNKGNVKLTNRACRRGTQNPNPIVDGSNNLTSAQKYTAQQITIAQRNISQSRYFAPTDTDVLLRFPVEREDIDRSIPMIYENDGVQKRTYFGPTTLKRLRVQLLNDRGYPVNLCGMNFSFSLLVDQLYQY